MKQQLLLTIAGLLILFSCKKEIANTKANQPNVNLGNKIAPDGFNFNTTKTVKLNISLLTNNNEPIASVIVNLYGPDSLAGSSPIFRGVTDKNGNLTGNVTVPAYYNQLVIDPAYVGLIRFATANIATNNSITATIGGKAGASGDIVATTNRLNKTLSSRTLNMRSLGLNTTDFVYPFGYTAANAFTNPTSLGVPVYLEPTRDIISATMLSYINTTLPETVSILNTHPEFLQNNVVHDINIVENSDVYITFVSEGAGYRNALAYFTYPTNNPPTKASGGTSVGGIDKITYVFPNSSALNSGGGLLSGQKVHLGTFTAGTTIGFCLVQNAWTGSDVDYLNHEKLFTINSFNPETVSSLQQHALVLNDPYDQVDLITFEDMDRQHGSDNDFNDVVFHVTSNPVTAISQTGIPLVSVGKDSDGDGVPDNLDAFPNDPTKAYITYYPSQTTYANIAFEDNWPAKGDYDMNDLVVSYRYTFVSNAQNQIVSMTGDYNVNAAGASFKNGFGVQLPVLPSDVQSVTGYKLSSGTYINLASNGVEAGQSKAVIIPFDTHDMAIQNPDFSYFVNTLLSKSKVSPNTISVNVVFNNPIDASVLSPSTLNPFLISNMRRGYEIHLPGYHPTDLADTKLFGALDDNSNPATGKYYLSAQNWPWAINYSNTFNYPIEGVNITNAFLHFVDWANSGGTIYPDWYSNTSTGYRNNSNIYSK